MRVLAIHNYYQQRGGEDQCFEDEVEVLKAQGHEVRCFTVHNDSIDDRSKLSVAKQSVWNAAMFDQIYALVRDYQPNIVHVMNTFPLLSPSILYAAKKAGATVVHEVQNYRMFCAGALLLRNEKHCEDCLGRRLPLPAIKHRCYRGSLLGSTTLAISSAVHRRWKTWERAVDLFICPSLVARGLLIRGGLPEDRIMVKPNALNRDPGAGTGSSDAFVFVGRLSPEKGLKTLFEVWNSDPNLPSLKIVGDGPESSLVEQFSATDSRVQWLGRLPLEQLLHEVGEAQVLVMPSVWNETFGRTTIEAFSKGTPVIGSRIGGTTELIDEGVTGWLFEPGSTTELLGRVRLAMQLTGPQKLQMRAAARQKFLDHYLPQNNYRALIRCYEHAKSISR